jgi:hypothetical protein
MVEQLSPGLSAFYATSFLIFLLLTQPIILGLFNQNLKPVSQLKEGASALIHGLESGAHNMIGIGVATAAAGVVVGTVTLTGLGPVMTEFVEWMSGGNLIIMLVMIAIISLILGMGLPTTANYIVVSSLMAPVVVTLAAQHGLVVPLIAVHLYVFYFGFIAVITPPGGLAAFAASAISKADPIKTGIQAFKYAMLTAILPMMFIFNTDIILYNVNSWTYATFIFFTTLLAMGLFASAIHGYFLVANKRVETLLLIITAFIIIRPGAILDIYEDQFTPQPASQLAHILSTTEQDTLRVTVSFEDINGEIKEVLMLLPVPINNDASNIENNNTKTSNITSSTPDDLLFDAGLELRDENGRVFIDMVNFDSGAQKAGFDFDQEIISVDTENPRPSKFWSLLIAMFTLSIVIFLQRQRKRIEDIV